MELIELIAQAASSTRAKLGSLSAARTGSAALLSGDVMNAVGEAQNRNLVCPATAKSYPVVYHVSLHEARVVTTPVLSSDKNWVCGRRARRQLSRVVFVVLLVTTARLLLGCQCAAY